MPRRVRILGLLKTGFKKLFLRTDDLKYHALEPRCVLDFYVQEQHQRSRHWHGPFPGVLHASYNSFQGHLSPLLISRRMVCYHAHAGVLERRGADGILCCVRCALAQVAGVPAEALWCAGWPLIMISEGVLASSCTNMPVHAGLVHYEPQDNKFVVFPPFWSLSDNHVPNGLTVSDRWVSVTLFWHR